MILAVLERRCGLKVSASDVYVSTVGGMRLTEPAADLAIAIAIASAVKDVALPPTLAAVGEISLAGEIRPVPLARQRLGEAKRLGYTQIVDGDAGTVHSAIGIALAAAPAEPSAVPAF